MSDEHVKQNEPVRLTSDEEQMKWLMCLQAATVITTACGGAPTREADQLYRELRKRCVR